MSEVALRIIKTPSKQTDADHPFITNVKKVITSEKALRLLRSMYGEMKNLIEKFMT